MSLFDETWSLWLLLVPIGLLVQCIYNAFLHPLANVPGPFWCRISAIPSWYNATQRKRHIWLWRLFEIYGQKVRIAPNTVLFRDPDAYGDIYSHKANVQKAPFYEAWRQDSDTINTFSSRIKANHTHRRKMLNQIFTDKSLKSAQSFITKHVDRWNEVLVLDCKDDGWSSPRNFTDLSDALVFDIMGDLCFGRSFDIKEPGDNPLRVIPRSIVEYMASIYPLTHGPMLELMLWMKPRGLDFLLKLLTPSHIERYHEFVRSCTDARLELYESQKDKDESQQRLDLFWYLCDAKDANGNRAYTYGELCAEANMLIIGALDTTSTAFAGFMFYITRHEPQYKRLADEIRSTFKSADDIVAGEKLNSCVYLRACIDETFRLAPSGPSELPRQILPRGTKILNTHYPAGTIVGIARWATGHDASFWGDSETFRPERWIPDQTTGVTQEDVRRAKANHHPFTAGPVACPGQHIAMLELSIAVARTVWRLDVRKPLWGENLGLGEGGKEKGWGERSERVFQLQDAYISVREGPMVQFRKRV